METLIGKALSDLTTLVADKWYAGVGSVGLVVCPYVMLKGTPHDDILIGSIGTAMAGFGFAEAETRTNRQFVDPHLRFKIDAPARRMTVAGVALYAIGVGGVIMALRQAQVL